jgi:hypothetical protein
VRPRGSFGILGWLLVRLRFGVVLFWAIAALAAYLYLPPIGSSTTSSLSDVVPQSAPAARAQSQAQTLSGSVQAPAILVYSNPKGFARADLERMRSGILRLNEGAGRPDRLLKAVPLVAENRSDPTQVDRGLLGQQGTTHPPLLRARDAPYRSRGRHQGGQGPGKSCRAPDTCGSG